MIGLPAMCQIFLGIYYVNTTQNTWHTAVFWLMQLVKSCQAVAQSHDFFTKTKDKQLYDGGTWHVFSFASLLLAMPSFHGSAVRGWCWPGTSSYPDFCNPEVG